MCGIIGYIGLDNATTKVINGLRNLEYRGYDSWGIASKKENMLLVKKQVGMISNFKDERKLEESNLAIGHIRWATHGRVSEINAHPHFSCNKQIALVHNGIIENYTDLKKELLKKKHCFVSQTDTEVIVHLIEEELKKHDIKKASMNAFRQLEGSFAVVFFSISENMLIAARKDAPLIIGLNDKGNFVASDINAFLQDTRKAIFLENNEIAFIGKDIQVFNFISGKKIVKKPKVISLSSASLGKGNFKHFMLKEIFEQPLSLRNAIKGRLNGKIRLKELSFKELKKFNRLCIVACGTSWHASLLGKYFIESLARIPVEVDFASEFRYRKTLVDSKTLLIAVSQSGETADTLAALREAKNKKARVLSLVNVPESSIARDSDYVLYLNAGPEIGVASTKAFTSQLSLLLLLALYLAQERKTISREKLSEIIRELKILPAKADKLLESAEKINSIAKKYFKAKNFLFLGRTLNYPIALEGALKLKEISYIHAEGYPAAEMKHGPIALIDKRTPSVIIAVKDEQYNKTVSNIEEVKARKGRVIAITTEQNTELKKKVDDVIFVPKTIDLLYPFLTVIVMQLFAYFVALRLKRNIDKPRNLAKSVTVE